jgi:hypothetical protein
VSGRRAIAAGVMLAIGLGARGAGAQSVASLPLGTNDRAALELSSVGSASPHDREVEATHFAPQVSGALRLGPRFVLTLDAALGYTSFRVQGEPRREVLRFANPFVGAHFAALEAERVSLRVGLGVGAPLVTLPGGIPANRDADFGDRSAAAARGMRGYWLWADNVVPVALLARAEANLGGRLWSEAEVQPAYLVSVNRRSSSAALLAGARAGYRLGPLTPGLGLHLLARSVPLAGHDFAQASASAFARYEQGSGWLRFELNANLDGPYGLGARAATTWGATLGGGARF